MSPEDLDPPSAEIIHPQFGSGSAEATPVREEDIIREQIKVLKSTIAGLRQKADERERDCLDLEEKLRALETGESATAQPDDGEEASSAKIIPFPTKEPS